MEGMMQKILLLAAAMSLGACAATPVERAEIGYPKGELGFAALASGDYAAAERQLAGAEASSDAAKMLNLAEVYRQTGRAADARGLYLKVLNTADARLVLEDRSIVTAHSVARAMLTTEVAMAQ
jgi:hypothetical protein